NSPLGIVFFSFSSRPQEFSLTIPSSRDGLWLLLLRSGQALFRATDEMRLEAGDVVYCSYNIASSMRFEDDFTALLVLIPQSLLHMRLMGQFSTKFGVLKKKEGTVHILADLLNSVSESMSIMTSEQLRPVEIAFTELFASCIADQGDPDAL